MEGERARESERERKRESEREKERERERERYECGEAVCVEEKRERATVG